MAGPAASPGAWPRGAANQTLSARFKVTSGLLSGSAPKRRRKGPGLKEIHPEGWKLRPCSSLSQACSLAWRRDPAGFVPALHRAAHPARRSASGGNWPPGELAAGGDGQCRHCGSSSMACKETPRVSPVRLIKSSQGERDRGAAVP